MSLGVNRLIYELTSGDKASRNSGYKYVFCLHFTCSIILVYLAVIKHSVYIILCISQTNHICNYMKIRNYTLSSYFVLLNNGIRNKYIKCVIKYHTYHKRSWNLINH